MTKDPRLVCCLLLGFALAVWPSQATVIFGPAVASVRMEPDRSEPPRQTDAPSHCVDGDGDGLTDCVDCDDTNPRCTTDCTDADGDGFCVTDDCDDTAAYCNLDCTDDDGDGFCLPADCDDSAVDTDADGDGLPGSCDNCPGIANSDQIDVDGFTDTYVIRPGATGSNLIEVLDLDGDSDSDVLSYDSDALVWHENMGDGTERAVICLP